MSGRVAIIGAGAFGAALACVVARSGREVVLWGRDADALRAMAKTHRNERYLPGAVLPEGIRFEPDLDHAARADVIVLALPTQALRDGARRVKAHLRPGTVLVAAAKGIEQASGGFVTAVIREELPECGAAVLSGPSFAIDIARGMPTAVTLAAPALADAERLAAALTGPGFRIYHSDDVLGVEIGGAAKNVLAIAAGIVMGAGLGDSARAALIARGFAELRRLAQALGARPETLMGLSGLGDLVLTASSPQSRNFSFGVALGQGRSVGEAAGGKLAEGAFTAPALARLACSRGVDMPISEAVAAVVSGKLSIRDAVTGLIDRPRKAE